MSSLKMHIAISLQIQKYFNFSDTFLVGVVLPDMFKIILRDKKLTHFLIDDSIDLADFVNTQNNIEDELVLGYFAHFYLLNHEVDNRFYDLFVKGKVRFSNGYISDENWN